MTFPTWHRSSRPRVEVVRGRPRCARKAAGRPTSYRAKLAIAAGLACCVTLALLTNKSAGEPPARSTWESLPADTVVAVRIPDGAAVAKALTSKTQLGTILLSEKRVEAIRQFFLERPAAGWDEFRDGLFEIGLEPSDFPKLFSGAAGYAVVVSPRANARPLWIGIAWLAPGEELAARTWTALGRAAEIDADTEHPVERIDTDVAGRPTIQLTIPHTQVDYASALALPDDYHELSEEQQEAAREEAQQRLEEAEETVTYSSLLAATLGDRILIAHSIQGVEEDSVENEVEELTSVFSRLITAHGSAGSEGFVSRVSRSGPIADVLDRGGTALVEAICDIDPLVAMARAEADDKDTADKVLTMLGARGLGEVALRATLTENVFHSDFFLATAAPREGILRLLDQPPLPSDPPAWIPSNVMSYSSYSLDLGGVYDIVKEETLNAFPERAEQGFQMVEMQANNFAQAELKDVLSALGQRHVVLSFEPEFESDDADVEIPFARSADRGAWVWQLTDEAIWSRLLNSLASFAGTLPSVNPGEEQGFRGLRMENSLLEGGLFHGKGYLVFAYGQGVLEAVLSALNSPPDGDASLRGSVLFAEATRLVDRDPGLGFEVTNGDRLARAAGEALQQTLRQMERLLDQRDDSDDQDHQAIFDLVRNLLPEEGEVDHMLGTGASRWSVNDEGLKVHSALELPPPQ